MGTSHHSNINQMNTCEGQEILDNYENEAFFDQNQQIENNQYNSNVYNVEEDMYDIHETETMNNYLQNEYDQANDQEMETDIASEPAYTQQAMPCQDYMLQQQAEQLNLQCNEQSLSL